MVRYLVRRGAQREGEGERGAAALPDEHRGEGRRRAQGQPGGAGHPGARPQPHRGHGRAGQPAAHGGGDRVLRGHEERLRRDPAPDRQPQGLDQALRRGLQPGEEPAHAPGHLAGHGLAPQPAGHQEPDRGPQRARGHPQAGPEVRRGDPDGPKKHEPWPTTTSSSAYRATATTAEVRQAYAQLAREQHPDRFPDPAEKARGRRSSSRSYRRLQRAHQREEPPRVRPESLERPKRRCRRRSPATPTSGRWQQFEAQDFHEAVELLRIAVHHAPGRGPLPRRPGARPWPGTRTGSARPSRRLEKAIQLAAARGRATTAELAELLLGQGLKLRARRPRRPRCGSSPTTRPWPRRRRAGPGTRGAGPGPGGLRGLLRRKP